MWAGSGEKVGLRRRCSFFHVCLIEVTVIRCWFLLFSSKRLHENLWGHCAVLADFLLRLSVQNGSVERTPDFSLKRPAHCSGPPQHQHHSVLGNRVNGTPRCQALGATQDHKKRQASKAHVAPCEHMNDLSSAAWTLESKLQKQCMRQTRRPSLSELNDTKYDAREEFVRNKICHTRVTSTTLWEIHLLLVCLCAARHPRKRWEMSSSLRYLGNCGDAKPRTPSKHIQRFLFLHRDLRHGREILANICQRAPFRLNFILQTSKTQTAQGVDCTLQL